MYEIVFRSNCNESDIENVLNGIFGGGSYSSASVKDFTLGIHSERQTYVAYIYDSCIIINACQYVLSLNVLADEDCVKTQDNIRETLATLNEKRISFGDEVDYVAALLQYSDFVEPAE